MPCYSKIKTVLIDVKTIEDAAKSLGIEVIRRNNNLYTLRHRNQNINIQRAGEGEKFETVAYTGTGHYMEDILQPLTLAYAKERMKQFARKTGYTVSADSKPNAYILTKYS